MGERISKKRREGDSGGPLMAPQSSSSVTEDVSHGGGLQEQEGGLAKRTGTGPGGTARFSARMV